MRAAHPARARSPTRTQLRSCQLITTGGLACLRAVRGVFTEPDSRVLFQVHLCASASVCDYPVQECPWDPAYLLYLPSADNHRWQPPLIGHARDRHPAYTKKPRRLFQVEQRLVNDGTSRGRRPGTARGNRDSQRPDYCLEYTRRRLRPRSVRCRPDQLHSPPPPVSY